MLSNAISVGILVPSYNHAKFISNRIDSILSQTFQNFTLYIVDDCSSDGTWELLQQYKSNQKVILDRSKKPSGSPFTYYKRYFLEFKHDYWWIAESDDQASSDFLDRLLNILEQQKNFSFAYSSSTIIDVDGNKISTSRPFLEKYFSEINWNRSQTIATRIGLGLLTRGQFVPNLSSMLFRSSALDFRKLSSIGNFKLAGDWFFVILLQRSGDGYYLNDELNFFRNHESTARNTTQSNAKSSEYFFCNFTAWKSSKSRNLLLTAVQDTLTMAKHDQVSVDSLIRGLFRISIRETIKIFIYLLLEFRSNLKLYVRRWLNYIRQAI